MRADRQQRQRNVSTCENTTQHDVSARQHGQRTAAELLTPLTSADARQPSNSAGRRIPLTLLTLSLLPTARNSRRTKGD
ncbi:hypothetical protein ACFWSJ_33935 [Streptomyces niveus]|uniref:hypothetical protein n=1 Tax=Streptomyces niveus TaxID=193462 RepID=UPI003660B9AB